MRRWVWRIRRLRPREAGLLVEAQLALLTCQVIKWTRPVGRLVELNSGSAERAVGSIDRRVVTEVSWAVTRASRYGMFRPKCLVRALTIQRMLRRRGIATSRMHIGVRLQNGAFEAHAWVELGGIVIGDALQHVRTFTPVADMRLVEF